MPGHAAEPTALELAVKAAFLYKFQLYVTWPHTAFASQSAPFNLCIVGTDPFDDMLDRIVRGQKVAQHPVMIRRLSATPADRQCHMMYVNGSDDFVHTQLAAVSGSPVLTVTDEVTGDSDKGMINFTLIDNRVRFEIDNGAAIRNGLAISSKLLGVAVSVRSS